jgi:large subunit ribosomal protein L23Ae
MHRVPKYPRKSVHKVSKMDQYRVIKYVEFAQLFPSDFLLIVICFRYPLTTESAMKKIEDNNTLVFITDLAARKSHIKTAVRKLYDVQALKINTLIRYDTPHDQILIGECLCCYT